MEAALQARHSEHASPQYARPTQAHPLLGRRVLIAEDEALVALDLEMTLQAVGAAIVGPALRLDRALALAEAEMVDAAVLDVMLGREQSFPLADRLHALGVAVVFHSGHAVPGRLRERYPDAGHCPKPCTPATIVRALAEAIDAQAEG